MFSCKETGVYGDLCRSYPEQCVLFHEYIWGGETTIHEEAFVRNGCPALVLKMVREGKQRRREPKML